MSDHAEDVKEPVEPVAESSPADQPEADVKQGDASPSESSPEKAPESGAQKRIRELTWKQREAERRAEEAEKRLQELSSRKPEPEASAPAIPVESDYDDAEAYRRDLDAYTRRAFREEIQASEGKRTQQEAEEQRRQKLSGYQEACAQYAAENPEFFEDLKDAQMEALPHILEFMTESEAGPQITHYLAKNPDHAARIEALSPVAAARELAKVELTISQAQPKKISDAPAPVPDVDDGPDRNPTEFTGRETVDEWMRKRAAQKGGRYRI